MRNHAVWAAVALSAVIVATTSTEADAFCHKYRSVPIWFGVYYPNCGPTGPCIVPYVIGGSICGYGCGYGCGYACGAGCGHGCLKKHHGCLFAHKACKRALAGCGRCFGCGDSCSACGDGCWGCGGGCDGGCSGSGCSSCGTGDGGSEDVLYDGPAADAPEASDQSASIRRPLMLLAGLRQARQEDGSAAFASGLSAYRQGTLSEASRDFETAAAAEPNNALYQYYRALTLYDMLGAEAANEALQQAVEAEKREPISGWGKQMERVQGRARVWVERARREAGLVR